MANTAISNLTASAANLAATDLLPVVQTAGVGPVKMTGTQLKAGVLGVSSFTAGYIPYASTTSALSFSSPIWTNGTAVGFNTSTVTNSVVAINSSTGPALTILGAGGYTTSPAGMAFGQYDATTFYIQRPASGTIQFWNSGTTSEAILDANGYFLIGYASSNGAYKLQVNSQIFATSSTIATSDAKYKENVTPLTGALAMVQALNPVTFDWKPHPVHDFDVNHTTTGFLAQELQSALAGQPFLDSLVRSSECTLPDGKKESFLGIAEGNMIAILTAAIKELKAEFDAYKATHP